MPVQVKLDYLAAVLWDDWIRTNQICEYFERAYLTYGFMPNGLQIQMNSEGIIDCLHKLRFFNAAQEFLEPGFGDGSYLMNQDKWIVGKPVIPLDNSASFG